jgi:hypothetical protein
LWGSLPSCVPIANRHARRLAIAAQDGILPHDEEVTGQQKPAMVFSALSSAISASLR